MNVSLSFHTESFINGASDATFSDRLFHLNASVNEALRAGDTIFCHKDLYDIPFYKEQQLADWVYSTVGGPLREEQRTIMLLIDRVSKVEDDEYRQHSENVKAESEDNPGFLCLLERGPNVLYVHTVEQLHETRRHYLCRVDDVELFVKGAKLCYPNLHFHQDVEDTMRTLGRPLGELAPEIVRHLNALNNLFPDVFRAHRTESLNKVLEYFAASAQLACTLEGDARSAKKRFTFQFANEDGEPDVVVCEPHTKIEGTGRAGDTEYLFNRIYFHQGKDDIHEGKILIAHIGKHL